MEGNEASVQQFEEAVRQVNAELLRSKQALTDLQVGELFADRLTQLLGLEFTVPQARLQLDRKTVRQAIESGGLSLLTREPWQTPTVDQLFAFGGLDLLTERQPR